MDFSVYMPPANECSLFLTPESENEVKRVIANLNDGSPGKGNVTTKTLKTVSDAVATPITHLANLSFIQGVFPQDLKMLLYALYTKQKIRWSSAITDLFPYYPYFLRYWNG